MPGLPFKNLLDQETLLPEASSRSFWLKGSAWEAPNFEHAETFVEKLKREGLLLQDPLVRAVLDQSSTDAPERTVRHRFARATGLTQGHIRQVERAREAAGFLRQGVAIPDVVYLTGYADQPHLTRALKKWVGYTPAQLVRKP